MNTPTYTPLSLSPMSAGEAALPLLRDPRSAEPVHQVLWVSAGGAEELDAYTGAALRARIESHVRDIPDAEVALWLPPSEPQLSRLYNLLGPLPATCRPPHDMRTPRRDPTVLLPALVIGDAEQAALAAELTRFHALKAGLGKAHAQLLAQAVLAFAGNGQRHASDSSCGIVVCASLQPERGVAGVVAVDQGQAICSSGREDALLRNLHQSSSRRFRSLAGLTRLARRTRVPANLTLRSGSARLQRGTVVAELEYVPGFVAALHVRLHEPSRPHLR